MSVQKILVSALVATSLSTGLPPSAAASTEAGSFQRMPKLPKIPKLPTLPKPDKRPTAVSDTSGNSSGAASNQDLEREFERTKDALLEDFSFNWTSLADNAPVDEAAGAYHQLVDRVTSGAFDSLPQKDIDHFRRMMKMHYDGRTTERWIDRQITFARGNRGNGAGDRTYNDLLVLETMLYGAVGIFPENEQYAIAKAKVDSVMTEYGGSRAGATQQKEAEVLAKAKSVRMPPATQSSRPIEDMFRRAWATGGIPYTIRKIHIRSGWSPKRNAYGIVIGKTRDAAIAAQDPATGICNLYDFTMIVETGGSPRRSSHSTKRIACENIPD